MELLDISIIMTIPIIAHLLVAVINKEIDIIKTECRLHTWSTVAFTDRLVCTECNKENKQIHH
jgi:hypothetical protein